MNKTVHFFSTCILAIVMCSGINASWEHSQSLEGAHVIALEAHGPYIFAGVRGGGVVRSGDSGVSWAAVNAGLTDLAVQALGARGPYLFAGTTAGGVFRSGDEGASWQAMNTGISTFNVQAFGGNDSFFFAGTNGGGVNRSPDGGAHWTEVNNRLVHHNIFAIGVTNRFVFVGTWGGSAFRTADNGLNWYLVTNGLFDPRENIIPYCFATADTFLFTGTGGGGVFRAKDSARIWYPFNTGLPDSSFVTALALGGDTIFAATKKGVFRSLWSGSDAAWVIDNSGLADTAVLSFASRGDFLFAGTDGHGVWRRPLSPITIPLPPLLSSPGGGASGIPVNPALAWSPSQGASSYTVQFSTASDFSALPVVRTGITAVQCTLSGLLSSTTYYWRVLASTGSGTSRWSAARSFTTMPLYAVSYNGNGNTGGTVPVDTNNYPQGATIAAPGNTGGLVKTGYSFNGWNTAEDGSGAPFAAGQTLTIAGANVVLFAQWKRVSLTLLRMHSVGDSLPVADGDTLINYGDTVLLTAPAIDGCGFIKWSVTPDKAALIDSASPTVKVIVTGDSATLTAVLSAPVGVMGRMGALPAAFDFSFNPGSSTLKVAIPCKAGYPEIPIRICLYDVQGRILSVLVDKKMRAGYYYLKLPPGKIRVRMWSVCRMDAAGFDKAVKVVSFR
jgi:uncharacterized repeat protein (TIGR02543 family)